FGDPNDPENIDAIHACLDVGINTFDTAVRYGNGHSEDILGQALKGVNRDDVVLIAKAWPTHYEKDLMEEGIDTSLKLMNTDYLDVYFLHYAPYWHNGEAVSIQEAVENICDLKKRGKIRAVGVSNFFLDELKEAQGYGQIDVIQPGYNLLWRYIDRDVLPYCIETNLPIISYSCLAQGLLTGTHLREKKVPDNRSNTVLFIDGIYEKCLDFTDSLKPFAEKYDATIPQLVISWMLATPGITAPLVGSSNRAQVYENIKALDMVISDEDYKEINEMSKRFRDSIPEYELNFNLKANCLSEAKKEFELKMKSK
ncbi:MAG: aldo/keto reductase, partial [Oscillospiraceae bacterium]|nr:aldo/keto reductase [Oscillospiraceae bacterium]